MKTRLEILEELARTKGHIQHWREEAKVANNSFSRLGAQANLAPLLAALNVLEWVLNDKDKEKEIENTTTNKSDSMYGIASTRVFSEPWEQGASSL